MSKELLVVVSGSSLGGLEVDTAIVAKACLAAGLDAEICTDGHRPSTAPQPDLTIHLERKCCRLEGKENWIIPNPEWPEDDPTEKDYDISIDRRLCKTRHAYEVFTYGTSEEWKAKVANIGWDFEDIYRPKIAREPEFYHSCGNSEYKGTAAIIAAWKKYDIQAPLHIVGSMSSQYVKGCKSNVVSHGFVSQPERMVLQNRCMYHLCPTEAEGWGHAIWEGVSCGAYVAATMTDPMTEMVGISYRIPCATGPRMGKAYRRLVSPEGVLKAVTWLQHNRPTPNPDGVRSVLKHKRPCTLVDELKSWAATFAEREEQRRLDRA